MRKSAKYKVLQLRKEKKKEKDKNFIEKYSTDSTGFKIPDPIPVKKKIKPIEIEKPKKRNYSNLLSFNDYEEEDQIEKISPFSHQVEENEEAIPDEFGRKYKILDNSAIDSIHACHKRQTKRKHIKIDRNVNLYDEDKSLIGPQIPQNFILEDQNSSDSHSDQEHPQLHLQNPETEKNANLSRNASQQQKAANPPSLPKTPNSTEMQMTNPLMKTNPGKERSEYGSKNDDYIYDCIERSDLPITHEAILRGHSKAVTALDIDYIGNRIITGSNDYNIRMYDLQGMNYNIHSYREIEVYEGYPITDVSFK
jgi:hypothetical protein